MQFQEKVYGLISVSGSLYGWDVREFHHQISFVLVRPRGLKVIFRFSACRWVFPRIEFKTVVNLSDKVVKNDIVNSFAFSRNARTLYVFIQLGSFA